MAQIQFSLIEKIKIGRPEHLLRPPPHPPPQSERHMCITPEASPIFQRFD